MEKQNFLEKYLHNHTYITIDDASPMYDVLVKMPKQGRMLEIGTGAGDSTLFFSRLKPEWMIYTMDIWGVLPFTPPNPKWLPPDSDPPHVYTPTKEDANRIFSRWKSEGGLENIIPIISNSRDLPWELELDAMFIDGDHYYEGVKSDFERFSPFVKKGGVIIFHDAALDAYYSQVYMLLDDLKKEMKVDIIDNVAIAYK